MRSNRRSAIVAACLSLGLSTWVQGAGAQCPPTPLWTVTPPITRGAGSPALDLTFIGRGASLVAIWSEDGPTPVPHVAGEVKWAWSAPSGASLTNFPSPVPLADGVEHIFVGAADGFLYKVNAGAGTPVASVDTRRPTCAGDRILGTPAVQLYSFSNAAFQTNAMTLRGQPDDLVFVITANQCGDHSENRIRAYWASNLDLAWTFSGSPTSPMDTGVEGCSVDYGDNSVYCGTAHTVPTANSLWAVTTLSGMIKWSHNAGSIQNRPMLNTGKVIVADLAGTIRKYSTSGTPVWFHPVGMPIRAKVDLETRGGTFQDRILVLDTAGSLHVIEDLGTSAAPAYPPVTPSPNEFTTAPAILPSAERAFIGRSDGYLQQIHLDTGVLEQAIAVAEPGSLHDPTLDSEGSGPGIDRLIAPSVAGVARLCVPFGSPASASSSRPGQEIALTGGPSPFRDLITLEYRLPGAARVEVAVFGVGGERLRTLATGWKPAGAHSVTWDGRDSAGVPLPSGVYFCRLKLIDSGGDSNGTYKIDLIR